MAYYELGNYGAAAKCFQQVRGSGLGELYPSTGHVGVNVRTWLSVCLVEQGEFAAALPLAQEGVRLAEAANRPWDLSIAHLWLGYLHLRRGDRERAVLACERGLLSCQAATLSYLFPFAASYLGYAYALCGRSTEALPLLEQAVERADAMGQVAGQARRVALLSEGYLLAGRQEDAMDTARRVVTLTQRHQERGNEAWALRLLAEIAAHADPPDVDQAETHYRQALALAVELGMRPLAAHCHLGLGTLYRNIGRDEDAPTELATAAELYRAMGMPYWLEKAEIALRQITPAPRADDVS
jgi:tetratricopeptide (TPR) repeat protein